MEITTPNLDPGQTDPITGRPLTNAGFENNLSRVKFETMMHDGRPPLVKPSFFSRVLSFLGGFAPLAAIAAPFTGGLSLIPAAAMAGAKQIGDRSQYNHNVQQAQAQQQPVVVSYPGMMSASLASDPTLSLISSRDASITDAIHR